MPGLSSRQDRHPYLRAGVLLATSIGLGVAAWLGYRFILWPDMTEQDTTPARGAVFGLVMITLLAAAARWTGRWSIGFFMPFTMGHALIYIVDHSGTNSDGLEVVGAALTVMAGLPSVFLVGALAVVWPRAGQPLPTPDASLARRRGDENEAG